MPLNETGYIYNFVYFCHTIRLLLNFFRILIPSPQKIHLLHYGDFGKCDCLGLFFAFSLYNTDTFKQFKPLLIFFRISIPPPPPKYPTFTMGNLGSSLCLSLFFAFALYHTDTSNNLKFKNFRGLYYETFLSVINCG
jgi:hypothetical protein